MKYYQSYMDRQEISPAVHEKLLDLEPPKKQSGSWLKCGALAACAALIIGVGVWKLAPGPKRPRTRTGAPISSPPATPLFPGRRTWWDRTTALWSVTLE